MSFPYLLPGEYETLYRLGASMSRKCKDCGSSVCLVSGDDPNWDGQQGRPDTAYALKCDECGYVHIEETEET